MLQLEGYYSRIVVEKSLISKTEFHWHLCECLNVTETYVFFFQLDTTVVLTRFLVPLI